MGTYSEHRETPSSITQVYIHELGGVEGVFVASFGEVRFKARSHPG